MNSTRLCSQNGEHMNYRIFYDAECPICCREMAHIRARNRKGNLHPIALQSNPDLLAKHHIDKSAAMTILHMVDDDGKVYAGMPVFRIIYRESGLNGLSVLLGLPGIKQFCDWFYPIFARNRYKVPAWLLPKPKVDCTEGKCQRKVSSLQDD